MILLKKAQAKQAALFEGKFEKCSFATIKFL